MLFYIGYLEYPIQSNLASRDTPMRGHHVIKGHFLIMVSYLPHVRPKKKYVCFRFPDRLTIFSPTDSSFFIVYRTTLREVMRF